MNGDLNALTCEIHVGSGKQLNNTRMLSGCHKNGHVVFEHRTRQTTNYELWSTAMSVCGASSVVLFVGKHLRMLCTRPGLDSQPGSCVFQRQPVKQQL